MQAENISEDEAYRKIRNESMQTQQEMVHIAQQIINNLQVNSWSKGALKRFLL